MFIARISKGRTIREFIIGVTGVPALGSCLWFAIFGATSINLGSEIAERAVQVTETAYFIVMEQLPFGTIISVITVVLLCTFFTTSANSATFVLGMLSTRGEMNPSARVKILWGLVQSVIALAMMMAGGLPMLQTISIVAAFPFAFVMTLACQSLMKALRSDHCI
jgi:glycine betaine transporter